MDTWRLTKPRNLRDDDNVFFKEMGQYYFSKQTLSSSRRA